MARTTAHGVRPSFAAAVAGVAGLAGMAGANHYGYWNSSQDYYIRVSHMLDFDQIRQASGLIGGLPNNGSMYCVPTSASNLMAYVERHGFEATPGVFGPGVDDWYNTSDTAAYATATGYIATMGFSMSTDAEDGTSNTNNAIEDAVDSRLPNNLFDVCYFGRTATWAPKVTNMASYMSQGAIVMFCYGRYFVESDGVTLTERDGGHCVTMTKTDKRAFMGYGPREFVINYTDPAQNTGSAFTQAPYTAVVQDITDVDYTRSDSNGTTVRRMSTIEIPFNPNDTRLRLIDSALAIFPKAAWSNYPQPSGFTVFSGGFKLGTPGGSGITGATFVNPDNAPIIWADFAADRGSALVQTRGNPATGQLSALWKVHLQTREHILLARQTNPGPVVVLPDRTILIDDGSVLSRYEVEEDRPTPGASPLTLVGRIPVGPGQSIDDASYDDQTRTLLVVSQASGELLLATADEGFGFQDSTGGVAFSPLPLPSFLNQVRRGRIAEAGAAVLVQDQSSIVRIPTAGGAPRRVFTAPAGSAFGPIETTDAGSVIFSLDGELAELEPTATGEYQRRTGADASPFAGSRVGSLVGLSRGRTNFTPREHSGPQWYNFDPRLELEPAGGTAIDCIVDVAEPFERLNVFDILAWFGLFGEGDAVADMNEDGVHDVFDILEFFRRFGAGC